MNIQFLNAHLPGRRSNPPSTGWALGLAMIVPLAAAAADEPLQLAERQFQQVYRPAIQKYCGDCHSGSTAEAQLDLSRFTTVPQMLERRTDWENMVKRMQAGEMPPADGTDLPDAERQEITTWLRWVLDEVACSAAPPNHTPSIRRLTRYEYRNSVRDLLGIDFQAADQFPADEVGYGFDNIGAVQTFSSLLVEKYLDAAELISRLAIIDPAETTVQKTFSGAELAGDRGTRPIGTQRILTTQGTVQTQIELPAHGDYTVRVTAYGQHGGLEWIEMGLVLDGRQLETVAVKSRERRPSQHDFDVRMEKGVHSLGVSFNNDYYNPDFPIPSARDRNLVVTELSISGPRGSESEELPAAHKRVVFVQSGESLSARQAAEQIASRLASGAFRRPVTSGDLAKLMAVFDQAVESGESFEGAIRLVLQRVLVSPHFLFIAHHPPVGHPDGESGWQYELASAISFFLWSSIPDEQLKQTASQGLLSQRATLGAEVRRMLEDNRSAALAENFAAQWLQLRLLDELDPDPELFGALDPQLRRSMREETTRLFRHVLDNNLPVAELLTADYTFADRTLCEFYGLEFDGGEGFQRISLQGTPRQGLLTHASILSITSNPNRTSPVKRGKWVLENLLNEPPPPPLPDVPTLENQAELTGTLRQRMEQHSRDPKCAVCHRKMDPIGFALENFDAVGRFRERDDGRLIDPTGALPDGTLFDGAGRLQQILATADRDRFARCVCEKLLIYALGRGLEYTDRCAVDRILAETREDGHRLGEIITAIVLSGPFQKRSVQEVPP